LNRTEETPITLDKVASVGILRQIDLKTEENSSGSKRRSCRKIAEKNAARRRQRNGANGLGEVPAPQFIHLYTQLQIKFVYSIDRKNGNKIIKPKTQLFFNSVDTGVVAAGSNRNTDFSGSAEEKVADAFQTKT